MATDNTGMRGMLPLMLGLGMLQGNQPRHWTQGPPSPWGGAASGVQNYLAYQQQTQQQAAEAARQQAADRRAAQLFNLQMEKFRWEKGKHESEAERQKRLDEGIAKAVEDGVLDDADRLEIFRLTQDKGYLPKPERWTPKQVVVGDEIQYFDAAGQRIPGLGGPRYRPSTGEKSVNPSAATSPFFMDDQGRTFPGRLRSDGSWEVDLGKGYVNYWDAKQMNPSLAPTEGARVDIARRNLNIRGRDYLTNDWEDFNQYITRDTAPQKNFLSLAESAYQSMSRVEDQSISDVALVKLFADVMAVKLGDISSVADDEAVRVVQSGIDRFGLGIQSIYAGKQLTEEARNALSVFLEDRVQTTSQLLVDTIEGAYNQRVNAGLPGWIPAWVKKGTRNGRPVLIFPGGAIVEDFRTPEDRARDTRQ